MFGIWSESYFRHLRYPILGERELQEEDIFRVDNLDKLKIDSGKFSAPIPFASNIVNFDS